MGRRGFRSLSYYVMLGLQTEDMQYPLCATITSQTVREITQNLFMPGLHIYIFLIVSWIAETLSPHKKWEFNYWSISNRDLDSRFVSCQYERCVAIWPADTVISQVSLQFARDQLGVGVLASAHFILVFVNCRGRDTFSTALWSWRNSRKSANRHFPR